MSRGNYPQISETRKKNNSKTNWASTMCHEMKTSVHSFQTISRSCRSCFSFQQVTKSSCLWSLNKRPEMSQLTGEGKENLNQVPPTSNPLLSHNTVLRVLTVLSLLAYTLVPLCAHQALSLSWRSHLHTEPVHPSSSRKVSVSPRSPPPENVPAPPAWPGFSPCLFSTTLPRLLSCCLSRSVFLHKL